MTSWRTDKQKTAERGYGGKWQRARLSFLRLHPLCVFCEREGVVTVAEVVDHIVPHKGDASIFWDRSNWQSLCRPHHDVDKRAIEEGRGIKGCDIDGVPRDPNHHWHIAGG